MCVCGGGGGGGQNKPHSGERLQDICSGPLGDLISQGCIYIYTSDFVSSLFDMFT